MENTKILTEAQIEALEQLAEAITRVFNAIWEMVKIAARAITKLWRDVLENYHNKRVVHLALHHGDRRVRKKNIARIMRWLRRYIRCRE